MLVLNCPTKSEGLHLTRVGPSVGGQHATAKCVMQLVIKKNSGFFGGFFVGHQIFYLLICEQRSLRTQLLPDKILIPSMAHISYMTHTCMLHIHDLFTQLLWKQGQPAQYSITLTKAWPWPAECRKDATWVTSDFWQLKAEEAMYIYIHKYIYTCTCLYMWVYWIWCTWTYNIVCKICVYTKYNIIME